MIPGNIRLYKLAGAVRLSVLMGVYNTPHRPVVTAYYIIGVVFAPEIAGFYVVGIFARAAYLILIANIIRASNWKMIPFLILIFVSIKGKVILLFLVITVALDVLHDVFQSLAGLYWSVDLVLIDGSRYLVDIHVVGKHNGAIIVLKDFVQVIQRLKLRVVTRLIIRIALIVMAIEFAIFLV